ncbi:Poly(3-hydroxybutyrate) depolymerase [Micromonospora matsumotoense]|uniref:Poly(3-hydroxybutyrate) depolymerase n=1 Tax=Micromonospora matsumotoense TaxID=121616 RepID=A0A1C5A3A7_9ACTN|nr:Poly(3-hydroxybutyrate) depolymerase [Micromonospora matsumotoense]
MKHRSTAATVAAAAVALTMAAGLAISGGLASAATHTATLATTAGCGKAPTLTSGTHTISSGGRSRSYILRIPDTYDNNHPYRLVFSFHWVGGTAEQVDNGSTSGIEWSYYGLRVDKYGKSNTIFVAPQGINNGWGNSNGQDLTFVDDMTRQIESSLCVDTTQLFASGFSYGGAMTYAIACARATVFRGVIVYSGGVLSGCQGGTQPIAYFGIHGLRDGTLPISGGRSMRDRFVQNNGCTSRNPPEPAQGSLTHIVTWYTGCRTGYPVVWGAFDGPHAPNAVDGSADPYAPGAKSWTQAEVWRFITSLDGDGPTTPPTTAPPTTPPPGNGQQIVGSQSGRCVDVPNSTQNNGTQVQLWDCGNATGQRFTYTGGRQLQVYGNKCLDANGQGTSNGTAVIIWDCNGGANQQWNVNANGTIIGQQSGLCLDANAANTANGTKLVLWSCNGGANQRWSLRS